MEEDYKEEEEEEYKEKDEDEEEEEEEEEVQTPISSALLPALFRQWGRGW